MSRKGPTSKPTFKWEPKMAEPRRTKRLLGAALAALIALGAVVLTLRFTQQLPSAPVPIVWDREACAECRMHIGEPRFAAQLQTQEGSVLNFDDPGCLLRYLSTQRQDIHAIYFHHLREDRWLTRKAVGFVPVEASPMGYNLGAVEAAADGALSFETAQAQVAQGKERGSQ